jgi:hypothetical protein
MRKSSLHSYINWLVPVLIILTLATFYHRFPTGDDAWFAEQSYWLSKSGIVRSNFFKGMLFWDQHLLVSHKFFILIGALVYRIFGISLLAFQSISFIAELILIGLIYQYIRQRQLGNKALLMLLFLIFGNISLVTMSFENRPEILLATLGFASFLCLDKSDKYQAALAGILAGLALLTHLNGIVFVVAGFFLLLKTKRWHDLIFYSITSFLVSILYFLDVFLSDHFQLWYYQFTNDPAVVGSLGIRHKLWVMLKFPLIFVGSFKEVGVTLILLTLLFLNKNRFKDLPKNVIYYLIFSILTLWLVTKSVTGFYQLLFLPLLIVLILELLNFMKSDYLFNKWTVFVFFLFTFIGVFGQIQLLNKIHSKPYLPEKYAEISKKIANKSCGIVPLNFFFNDYDKFGQLYCIENFWPMNVHREEHSLAQMGKFAIDRNVKFIVIDKHSLNKPAEINPKSIIPDFKLSYTDGNIFLFNRKK